MMSYPTESEKGAYIGLFWAIFNMGGVIGSIVPIADLWDLGTQNLVVKDGKLGAVETRIFLTILKAFTSDSSCLCWWVPSSPAFWHLPQKSSARMALVWSASAILRHGQNLLACGAL